MKKDYEKMVKEAQGLMSETTYYKLLQEIKEVNTLWDELIGRDLFTNDELLLITNINGYSIETLNDAIYARYGYRDLNQMLEE